MMFALTRSNLRKQLPDGNGIILRLTEIVTERHSISPIENSAGGEADKSEHIFENSSKMLFPAEVDGHDLIHNCLKRHE